MHLRSVTVGLYSKIAFAVSFCFVYKQTVLENF